MRRALLATTLALTAALAATGQMQQRGDLPHALTQMIDAERAFAGRALVVGWKAAFLEYFADGAVGFDGGVGLAHDQIRARPDPPPDHQLVWEPRYGDVAASGELGYLTGPARSVQASRDRGRPRHSTYLSVWKRQRDGAFKVALDIGTDTPGPPPFPAGFTRAASANRFTGDYDENTPPLSAADGVLNSGLRTSLATAYRGRVAPDIRVYRRNMAPVVGERAVMKWLPSQRAFTAADSRYAEAARSGDLGYTWGTYTIGPRQKPADEGFYVRVWVRERNGQWQVAVDVLQPRAASRG